MTHTNTLHQFKLRINSKNTKKFIVGNNEMKLNIVDIIIGNNMELTNFSN